MSGTSVAFDESCAAALISLHRFSGFLLHTALTIDSHRQASVLAYTTCTVAALTARHPVVFLPPAPLRASTGESSVRLWTRPTDDAHQAFGVPQHSRRAPRPLGMHVRLPCEKNSYISCYVYFRMAVPSRSAPLARRAQVPIQLREVCCR